MDADQFLYEKLIEGLRLAASPYAVQRKTLPEFVHQPDEILMAVDHVEVEQLIKNGRIGNEQAARLREYDADLDTYTKTDDYAAAVADLANGPWFNELRERAKALLGVLGESYKTPSLAFDTYVPAH